MEIHLNFDDYPMLKIINLVLVVVDDEEIMIDV
jgi:hypothetical protein